MESQIFSDFGSANLVRLAATPGEGAIIYAAPETFPPVTQFSESPSTSNTKDRCV